MKKPNGFLHLLIFAALLALAATPVEASTIQPVDPGSGTGGVAIITPAEAGKHYDALMRKSTNLPPEWFGCKTNNDCGLAHVPCNTSLAVGKDHKADVESAICHGTCAQSCLASMPDTSLAVCDNGQCATVIPPYQPMK